MDVSCLSFEETGYFSGLIGDYLAEKASLKPFYHRFPTPENFGEQINEKKATFPRRNREVLCERLQQQYGSLERSALTLQHIKALKNEHTFTVTTGHQLTMFTGPLYFFYKIITTINLAQSLKKTYPDYHFVPVYWMATEDHDFEEIRFFNYNEKRIEWRKNASGAVGQLATEGLDKVWQQLEDKLGTGKNAIALKALFREAYLQHKTLAEATRYLVNALFGAYGLVIIDGDDKALKTLFTPYLKEELQNETSFKTVSKTAGKLAELSTGYKIQVHPRECNLFYLKEHLRERIIRKNDTWYVNETDIKFSREAILKEVEDHPERFSPNVIMRPLYQEVILPNLCYIGGGGELAYWLELKGYFEASEVPFPMLMLRNSVLILSEKQLKKLTKLHISPEELFLGKDALVNRKVKAVSDIPIDFTPQRTHLKRQFKDLYELAERTDKSFLGAVKAQEVKQLKGLDRLEKRLLKAQKRKEAEYVTRITEVLRQLFPGGSLQERALNFSGFYMEYGEKFIETVRETLPPFPQGFLILMFTDE